MVPRKQSPVVVPDVWRARLGTIVRVVIALAIVAWLVREIGLDQLRQQLADASPGWLLAAFAIGAVESYGKCWNWYQLLRGLSARAPVFYRRLLHSYWVGALLGAVLPSSAGTDAIRAVLAQRAFGGHLAAYAASMVVMNVVSLFASCLMGLAGIALLAATDIAPDFIGAVALIYLGVIVAAVAAYSTLKYRRRWLLGVLRKFRSRWFGVRRSVRRFADALLIFEHAHVSFRRILLSAFLVQLVTAAVLLAVGLSLGLSIPFAVYMVASPLIRFVGLTPASVSGFGAHQALNVVYFGAFGVGAPEAFLMSTLHAVIVLALNVVFGGAAFGMGPKPTHAIAQVESGAK